MRRVVSILGVVILGAAPLLFAGPVGADTLPPPTCPVMGTANDFLTGGGFIIGAEVPPDALRAHANFGVGGGCKQGGSPHGLWGHLEYIDHGQGLNVHWTTIKGYTADIVIPADSKARDICGTATTNLYGDVDFFVRAADDDQTGGGDKFDIQLTATTGTTNCTAVCYTTFANGPHTLVGGNIVLHNPNPSTMGSFTGTCPTTPSFVSNVPN